MKKGTLFHGENPGIWQQYGLGVVVANATFYDQPSVKAIFFRNEAPFDGNVDAVVRNVLIARIDSSSLFHHPEVEGEFRSGDVVKVSLVEAGVTPTNIGVVLGNDRGRVMVRFIGTTKYAYASERDYHSFAPSVLTLVKRYKREA